MKIPFTDIISVQPISKPTGKLFYLDYEFKKFRREKIEKIMKRINVTTTINNANR